MKMLKDAFTSITAWMGRRPHTKAMYITAIGTIVMAIMTVVMGYSLFLTKQSLTLTRQTVKQNSEALSLTRTAVSLQNREFTLRNRPFVTISKVEFGGPSPNMEGQVFPHTVRCYLSNLADIPANNVAGFARAVLDGKEIHCSRALPAAMTKNNDQVAFLSLSEEHFALATNRAHKFQVNVDVTYGGMLGEEADQYHTRLETYYSPDDNSFRFTQFEFK